MYAFCNLCFGVLLLRYIDSGNSEWFDRLPTIDRLDHESHLIEIDYKVFLVKNWSV